MLRRLIINTNVCSMFYETFVKFIYIKMKVTCIKTVPINSMFKQIRKSGITPRSYVDILKSRSAPSGTIYLFIGIIITLITGKAWHLQPTGFI